MTSPLLQPAKHDEIETDAPEGGVFYRCENVKSCGLRFPVTVTDPFRGRCPRCGAAVQVVARIDVEAATTIPSEIEGASTPSNLRLLLDNWRSLFNVGAAFRTADGAGASHLYLCGITATPESQRKLAKTALGAERFVAWSYHVDAVEAAKALQASGAQIWVLERSHQAQSLFDIKGLPVGLPIVLAAGNEVIGVDPGLVAMADKVIQLPMLGSKQSLNVAVALSIAVYWLRAQEQSFPQTNSENLKVP